jgi:DNA-binding NtrC family response regulator
VRLHRILLADSDARVAELTRDYLARCGYDVATCGDALSCAEQLHRSRPDVLVLDPDLPWGQGAGVLALMADGELPAVPVVMLAAGPDAPPRAPADLLLVRSVVPRAAPPHRLEHGIRRALNPAGGRAPA